jgi:hypothetical protein
LVRLVPLHRDIRRLFRLERLALRPDEIEQSRQVFNLLEELVKRDDVDAGKRRSEEFK